MSFRQLQATEACGEAHPDAGSAVATFSLHCITSLPANQCLLSRCTPLPPPQTLPHVTLCPRASAAATKNPLWCGRGWHREVGIGSWMDIKATGNRSLSRKVLLHGKLTCQECVFCSHVPPPPKTQWVGGQQDSTTGPWRDFRK